ncbi:hypothetical protein [Actinocrispum wychmicini]|uniref:Uncharacterized protein n=1 Tax=Actinocrispum wychmicini TaxID=1213861 RepID=A0A4R2JLZ9_9PSEU|nr:hypothetical protein [Actinocrispum wychmicini]TCO61081.1 hypothetical protein EV192_103665 [Actinocrispum wychmicini]
MFDITDGATNALAYDGAKRVIHDVLRAQHGQDAVIRRPISAQITIPSWQPASYVAGIAAARTLAAFAHQLMRDYARKARGEGSTWAELAAPLGITPDHNGTTDPAEAAFLAVAGKSPRRFDTPTVSWTCTSCDRTITDRGPYNGHPADNETGHTTSCGRHNTEITHYMAELDA